MKAFFSYSSALSLIVLAAAITSCNKDQPKTAGADSTSAKATDASIVFVNSDSLGANYEYYKETRIQIEDKSKKAQVDLTAKGNAFQREVNEYQQAAQTLSADQRAATEERLARKQRELQSYNQNASSALANESAAENEKIYNKIAAYLKEYAKKKGYKYVLSYSKAMPTVLFADESLDVTKEVVAGLNEEYKKEKK